MAVSALPAARAVRAACFKHCFAEQMEMEQKKQLQLLIISSQKNYPPASHSLRGSWRPLWPLVAVAVAVAVGVDLNCEQRMAGRGWTLDIAYPLFHFSEGGWGAPSGWV
jgi:hypothetical protein